MNNIAQQKVFSVIMVLYLTLDKEIDYDFTSDFGRHRVGSSTGSGLRHRHPQRSCWDGASLQSEGATAVREAGAYNTQKNKAKRFGFQSGMCSRIYLLCAGLCLCGERCTGFSCWLLAAACHLVYHESD